MNESQLGCDTGFGFQLASKLHKMGFVVYAGCLFENGEGGVALRNQVQPNNLSKLVLAKLTIDFL